MTRNSLPREVDLLSNFSSKPSFHENVLKEEALCDFFLISQSIDSGLPYNTIALVDVCLVQSQKLNKSIVIII